MSHAKYRMEHTYAKKWLVVHPKFRFNQISWTFICHRTALALHHITWGRSVPGATSPFFHILL